ncbi:MAG: hypothetical protein WCI77_08480 [Candidatus Omnitrophota bacterium]
MLEMKLGPQDKIKIGVVILLVIILIFAVVNAIKAGKKQKNFIAQSSSAAVLPSVQNDSAGGGMGGGSLYHRLENESDRLKLGRDPFTRSQIANTAKEDSSINLSGIIWDTKNPKAVINGEILSVGEKVKGNLIVEIRPDKVILSDGERQFEVSMNKF